MKSHNTGEVLKYEFFNYKSLEKFLVGIRDRYPIMLFSQYSDSGNSGILLRHDIDYNVEKAYKMALVENMCGIKSTYFVMMSCYTYNPFAEENRIMLRKMAFLGFEIGLHFDPAIYDRGSLVKSVAKEMKALEFITSKTVSSISLHNLGSYGENLLFDNYINACDSSIFSDEVYMSDSHMDFRGKDPYKFVKKASDTIIQVLLHPCCYREYEDSTQSCREKLLKGVM